MPLDDPDPAPGSPGGPLWDPGAIPAATIIPLRDGGVPARERSSTLEVLMLRRDTELRFAGGMWVFPGGRIDPEDFPGSTTPDQPSPDELEAAARAAALREAGEEAGIAVDPATIRRWSQWTPPPPADAESLATAPPRAHRFTTAFFVGVAVGDTDAVTIDHGEIRDHRWVAPAAMLEAHAAGEVTLAPPTFITLAHLAPHRNPAEVLMAAPGRLDAVEHFATRVGTLPSNGGESSWVALYHGDVAYEGEPVDAPGARHRLVMADRWIYERHDGTGEASG